MRISDWSSDVCSSDLHQVAGIRGRSMLPYLRARAEKIHEDGDAVSMELHGQRSVRQGKWKLLWLPRPMGSGNWALRSEEHTSELQSLMRISYAVFCLKKKKSKKKIRHHITETQ